MSTTAMWLLLAVVVILILFFSVLYKRRFTVHELALTGVMAALSLVAYLFFRIPFYGGSSFHLGNTFTALTALLLDGGFATHAVWRWRISLPVTRATPLPPSCSSSSSASPAVPWHIRCSSCGIRIVTAPGIWSR